jgi:hypothetical protein
MCALLLLLALGLPESVLSSGLPTPSVLSSAISCLLLWFLTAYPDWLSEEVAGFFLAGTMHIFNDNYKISRRNLLAKRTGKAG